MDELLPSPPLDDVRYPLEVTFIGEAAANYGGPRKEFLGCVMRALCDKLFLDAGNEEFKLKEDVTSLRENHYYGAGLIFGKEVLPGSSLLHSEDNVALIYLPHNL